MRNRLFWVMLMIVCLAMAAMAQTNPAPAAKPAQATKPVPTTPTISPAPPAPPSFPRIPRAWWKDSEVAAQLNLTDQQKTQLEQTFTDYRMKLIDLRAAVEREEAKLEPLVESDKLDANAVSAQLDALIAARGRLEKTNAMMGIDMRRLLTQDQWKKLRELHPGPPGGFGGRHGWGHERDRRDRDRTPGPGMGRGMGRGMGQGPAGTPPPPPPQAPQDEED